MLNILMLVTNVFYNQSYILQKYISTFLIKGSQALGDLFLFWGGGMGGGGSSLKTV